jgi:hypothetical protein
MVQYFNKEVWQECRELFACWSGWQRAKMQTDNPEIMKLYWKALPLSFPPLIAEKDSKIQCFLEEKWAREWEADGRAWDQLLCSWPIWAIRSDQFRSILKEHHIGQALTIPSSLPLHSWDPDSFAICGNHQTNETCQASWITGNSSTVPLSLTLSPQQTTDGLAFPPQPGWQNWVPKGQLHYPTLCFYLPVSLRPIVQNDGYMPPWEDDANIEFIFKIREI